MPVVHLPGLLRHLAGGAASVEAGGATLRAVFNDLERRHPGIGAHVLDADGIRPDVMVAINADEVRDLDAPVPPDAEVHILPAIAGG